MTSSAAGAEGGREERRLRGVRGATTVALDDADAIIEATSELLARMLEANALDAEEVVSAVFTATPDITAAFPARAARGLGWDDVPLLCALAPAVPGDPPRCIRVLLHIETLLPKEDVSHVYLHGARALRPDLSAG